LIPYAVRIFQTIRNDDVARAFQSTFSRPVVIHFLGLWDTVTSMGNVWSPVHWPNTTHNPSVANVCHAIALDERRSFFRENRWGGDRPIVGQTVSQVWFAGVHCDVGGGYPASSGRLWAITLEWMVEQAVPKGLLVDAARFKERLADGAATPSGVPDCDSEQHNSLTMSWKPLELVPKPHRRRNPDGSYGAERFLVPALTTGFDGRPRELLEGEKVHRSAVRRFVEKPNYSSQTLIDAGLTADEAKRFLETSDAAWTVPQKPKPTDYRA
jgi:hypothetical protein